MKTWCQNIFQQGDEHSSTMPIEMELKTTFETFKHTEPVNCWLPHPPITSSSFEAIPTFVDYQCVVYLQLKNDGMKKYFF